MDYVRSMVDTHPAHASIDPRILAACTEACFECVQTCTACADACLAEDTVRELRRCIRLNLDCADVCLAAGRMLSRETEIDWAVLQTQLEAASSAAKACGDECHRHAQHHEHCRICMEACRKCEEACTELLSQVSSFAV
jgi:hypothetical protein